MKIIVENRFSTILNLLFFLLKKYNKSDVVIELRVRLQKKVIISNKKYYN